MSDNFIHNLILSDEEYRWSYSRVDKYKSCKYAWYLKYLEEVDTEELFFSQFGKFVHKIYAEILLGNLKPEDAEDYFLVNYRREVTSRAPSDKVFLSYFKSGLDAMHNIDKFLSDINDYEIIGVETPVDFKIDNRNFVGIIDLTLKDSNGDIIIVDHKSRTLKPRSKKGNLKSDLELEKYLQQLYIYSLAIKDLHGRYPSELWFHCYRNADNKFIKESFSYELLNKTVDITLQEIDNIVTTSKWSPNINWFSCANLCECHNECEYYQTNNG